jgi:hypothetical protein
LPGISSFSISSQTAIYDRIQSVFHLAFGSEGKTSAELSFEFFRGGTFDDREKV